MKHIKLLLGFINQGTFSKPICLGM